MPLRFHTTRRSASFLNSFNKFEPTTLEVEIRTDPLTGDVARILPYRLKELPPYDHQGFVERSRQRPCPFCPDNIEAMAARFIPDRVPEGRLGLGEAVCFPNAFPYEALNGVVVLCREHYLTPAGFTREQLADALELASRAFARVGRGLKYGSVNWNYMMPAGAGLVHPHFQIAAGRTPTSFQARLRRRAQAWARKEGGELTTAYLEAERAGGARWVGETGRFAWMTAFAPRGIFDVMALARNEAGILAFSRQDFLDLAQGLTRVLAYFEKSLVGSYNMALHTSLTPGAGLPFMLRLVSRVDLPPSGMDEINYFEKLHDERLTFHPPEGVAAGLKGHFT